MFCKASATQDTADLNPPYLPFGLPCGTTRIAKELEIELYNGSLIIFTENQFENYVEVKTGIYIGKRNA